MGSVRKTTGVPQIAFDFAAMPNSAGPAHIETSSIPRRVARMYDAFDAFFAQKGYFMKFRRRQFVRLAAGCAALPVVSRIAAAQTYPLRRVRLLEGFGPGSTPDIVARLIGQWLSERLGQPFIIENRTGASGNIATEAVVNAQPDGYTLLTVTTANAIGATFYEKLNFDFARDITPVASAMRAPFIMEVNPSVPAKTVIQFIAYAKANPGRINMASAGNGSGTHVAGELFKMMTGIDMIHVPYRGAPALADLVGGQVQVYFGPLPSSIDLISAGRLRALAVTTTMRSQMLPDTPALREFVPGYEASTWYGIGAPRNTPLEILDKLNKEINAALADPGIKARFAGLGGSVLPGSRADFAQLIADETEKWARLIRTVRLKAE
jgi:tripartite-type tricarboxylate transporter receptor subunit TctC